MICPNKSAAANHRPAGQLDGSDNLAAIVAADRAFPAAVAELGRWLVRAKTLAAALFGTTVLFGHGWAADTNELGGYSKPASTNLTFTTSTNKLRAPEMLEKKLSFDYQLTVTPPPPLSAEKAREAEYTRAILGIPPRPRPSLSLSLERSTRPLLFSQFPWDSLNTTNLSQPDGPANRSQPVRSGTNSTSSAAGSTR